MLRLALLLGILLVACGGGDDDVDVDVDVDAATRDGNTGADGGGTSDSGAASDDRLYPAEVGRSWTYQVAAVGAGSVCAAGSYSEDILGTESVAGRTAFEVDNWCSAVGSNHLVVDGDKVEFRYQEGWIVTLDTPVEEGHTWNSTGAVNYVWKVAGTVTVPAGTFADCWKREQIVSYTAYAIYCRGIGEVRSYSEDLAGNGWDAQLAAKSF